VVRLVRECRRLGIAAVMTTKTAWDLLWLRRSATPIDWELLTRWMRASRLPRALWASLTVLEDELDLAVPAPFLAHAPADARQRRLQTVARDACSTCSSGPASSTP